ncbi:hypothetical protein H0I31_12330 [Tenacibaculum sp. AHE15PA]|uniref:hypothetical protein n=1 Tax=unclassified Tenacibaculum TaxID=2635139 RepID=UPI001C4F0A9E|nr:MULTISPECIES: hypothetical protein [unclassified Tenacibaculum]QXP73682.1 hypothetical protein H0I30_00650 [Tenacibaculum sp. AHE14PA]QXP75951.1 hypothetical protein H0I31_12330 [Tenacibaculum sp. AHE15PA]
MALQISQKNGNFFLNGKLNSTTSRFFIIYFEHNIEQLESVTINIDNVNEISRDGLEAISTLTAIALRNDKLFSVTGYGCKEIYDDFNQMNVA